MHFISPSRIISNDKILYGIVCLLLCILAALNMASALQISDTSDEVIHLEYGMNILKLDSTRSKIIYDSAMPFSSLNALPLAIGGVFDNVSASETIDIPLSELNTARYSTMIFSLLLGWYVFRWSRRLYGTIPGLFSLVLYVFSPNILAHSRLVTLDLYAACMMTIAVYYLWQFMNSLKGAHAVMSACTLGIAQLAKYSCILLYPIFLLLVVGRYTKEMLICIKNGDGKEIRRMLLSCGKYIIFFIAVSIVIINIGFFFNNSFVPLGDYSFKSVLFDTVKQKYTLLHRVPFFVPFPFIEGLDWVAQMTESGFDDIYLLGEWRLIDEGPITRFKSYCLITLLLKVPLAVQILFVLSLVGYVIHYKKYNFFHNEFFLLLPICFLLIYFSFFFAIQIGIRHYIVILPFIHIFCGSLITRWAMWGWKRRSLIVGLLLFCIISVLSYFPYYIPYFNELIGDRKQAYTFLIDSNIEWSNGRNALMQYQEKYPDIQIDPEEPVAGRIVVNVNALAGLFDRNKYQWLRDHFKPIDHIAYAYLVYEITAEELAEKMKG